MSNQHLVKSAHIWFLAAAILACGLWAIGGKAGANIQDQNSNQNSNANSSKSQNRNANKAGNKNTGATGEQAGMANMSSQDHDFLMDAAMGGLMEVELGKVAAQQGSSEGVKQFGQRMVDDHSKANTELMTLASGKGITLPTELDAKHREEVTKLSAMSGAEFDRAYMNMMVSDHNKDVAAFEKESTKGGDPDLKAFATKTLPTLKEHQQLAKTLRGSQGGNTKRTGNSNSNRP
jgi:putative membrane protein